MAELYDIELTDVLEQLVPAREFTRGPRTSNPWFDKECRVAMRLTRWLERTLATASRRAAITNASSSSSVEMSDTTATAVTKAG